MSVTRKFGARPPMVKHEDGKLFVSLRHCASCSVSKEHKYFAPGARRCNGCVRRAAERNRQIAAEREVKT